MSTTAFSITNVTAVLPNALLDNATITIENGIIADISERGEAAQDSLNGGGSICIPGIIDTHSDGYEQELRPHHRLPIERKAEA